jgi:hypothetical protein
MYTLLGPSASLVGPSESMVGPSESMVGLLRLESLSEHGRTIINKLRTLCEA